METTGKRGSGDDRPVPRLSVPGEGKPSVRHGEQPATSLTPTGPITGPVTGSGSSTESRESLEVEDGVLTRRMQLEWEAARIAARLEQLTKGGNAPLAGWFETFYEQLLEQLVQDETLDLHVRETLERLNRQDVQAVAAAISKGDLAELRAAVDSLIAMVHADRMITDSLRERIEEMYADVQKHLVKPVRDPSTALVVASRLITFLTTVFELLQRVKGVHFVWHEYDELLSPFINPSLLRPRVQDA